MFPKYLKGSSIILLLLTGVMFKLIDTTKGITCRGIEMKPWPEFEKWKSECKQQFQGNGTENISNNLCYHKCVIIKLGFLNESGDPNKEKSLEAAKKLAPQEFISEMGFKFQECLTVHGSKVKELGLTCEAFAAVCLCRIQRLKELCESKDS